ncbi:MAG TPA: hypothetical protein VFQ79_25575 [Bryobacteraceae bacterium]|nr:hypothetical protein [Bryobacteraceae bacterium]
MAIDLARDIVLRWEDQDPALAPMLKDGGTDVVLVDKPVDAFLQACQKAGLRVASSDEIVLSGLQEFRNAGGRPAALTEGLWPGISRTPNTTGAEDVASASHQPWVDANGFRIAWLKALCPERQPAVAYKPDEHSGVSPDRVLPYDSLELALVEAWVSGANYVLAVEPRYRKALVDGDAKAIEAWRRMGRSARWLKEHKPLFGHPFFPAITMLVDEDELSAELANLAFRQNACPALEPAARPPAPDPDKRPVVVAASLTAPEPGVRSRILAHAEAGSTLIVDREDEKPWWHVPALKLEREEPDRETYRLGRGKVIAYRELISDPSDFALDMIDAATHQRRAVRIWNALSVIATATSGPASGPFRARAIVQAINYGRSLRYEILMRVSGEYSSAVLLRPEGERVKLTTARRGTGTEFTIPHLEQVGIVLFS